MMKRTGIAAFSDLRTPSADGVRDAITMRPSASANFFVNSVDKVAGQTSANFTINKNQSLFNGFFNRLAVAEIVLEWNLPNVSAYWGNNTFSVTNFATGYTANVTIPSPRFYKPVELLQLIAFLVNQNTTGAGDPLRLEVGEAYGNITLITAGAGLQNFIINASTLASQLFNSSQIGVAGGLGGYYMSAPLVLGTRYIDIVCQQLTYNQDLKDNTTSTYNRDVLYRWYFADDNVPEGYDTIVKEINAGDPAAAVPYPPTFAISPTNIQIAQGNTSFTIRRTPPVAKQIRWSPEQPIGQVNFQVYDDTGRLIDLSQFSGFDFEFQLSMLLSED